MENNIDTQLELAISTRNTYNESEAELYIGYSSEKSTWQLLIRYNDDISDLVERYRMQIYYLLAGYAIIEISEAYLNAFAADPRIIYIDKPKSVEQQVSYAQYASCLSGTFINNYGLDGDGTIFAIIDSGIDYRHNEFVRDGKSRILSFWDQQAVYQDTYANTYKLGRIYTNEELNSILDGSYAGILPFHYAAEQVSLIMAAEALPDFHVLAFSPLVHSIPSGGYSDHRYILLPAAVPLRPS